MIIVVGIVLISRRGTSSSPPVTIASEATRAYGHERETPIAAPATPPGSAIVGALWSRSPPQAAVHNARRCRYGLTLKPFGSSDDIIERLADGDIQAAVSELKQRAREGDASAGNQLLFLSRFTCGFAALDGPSSAYHASQSMDSQALPAADGDWLHAVIQERENYNQQLLSVCHDSLDGDEINAWVNASAANGDPASHYLLAVHGANRNRNYRDTQLLAAVNGGYPWAQFLLGQRMINGMSLSPNAGTLSENAGDLVRAAALELPEAESYLAKCEFSGCIDIPVDIASATAHALDAASRGYFDAIQVIGPQLQASQIDPNEVEAWNLIAAALKAQQASSAEGFKSASGTLNSPTVSASARKLADQNWQKYGKQIMANLGCGT
jgi:hypothetical protein